MCDLGNFISKCKFLLAVSKYPCHKIHHVGFRLVFKRHEECSCALYAWPRSFNRVFQLNLIGIKQYKT